MTGTVIRLRKPLNQILKGKIEPFTFEVGVLQDAQYRRPGKGMKPLAGGITRTVGRKPSGKTIAEVGKSARQQLRVNYLTAPFKGTKKNADAVKMMKGFWGLVFGEGKIQRKKRLENLIQAVVRNPITRADYGRNKKLTRTIKGSNRKFLDTGQLFKKITAKVRLGRRVS